MTLALHLSRVWRRRPQTKGKVESQMKILDEIHAYQGKLTIQEVEEQIQKIILRSNLGDFSSYKTNTVCTA